jgi:hypothetical protein
MTNYLKKLHDLSAKERIDFFTDICLDSEKVQSELLLDIIHKNLNTRVAKRYNFSQIDSYKSFIKNVPITNWEDYKDDVEDMKDAKEEILFRGKTEYFTQTSGTTGKMKHLPESADGKLAKQLTTSIRTSILFTHFPDLFEGKYLPIVNSSTMGYTKAGIAYGSASGLTMKNITPELLKFSAIPPQISAVEDMLTYEYLIMRFAIAQDVRLIAGNNAGRIESLIKTAQKYRYEIIKDIRDGTINKMFKVDKDIYQELSNSLKADPKRADELSVKLKNSKEFLPSLYWPNLHVISCWLSGSIGAYIKKTTPYLQEYKREVLFFDGGYGASEAKINIPLKANEPAGALAIYGAFFEFMPLNSQSSKPLLAHELKDKGEYRLIITTYSGLYRYDMKDIIKVNGFSGTTPNIYFLSKSSDIGNICGEKLSSTLVHNVVEKFFDIPLEYFCAVADKEHFTYILCIEPKEDFTLDKDKKERLITEIEEYISKANDIYNVSRKQHLLSRLQIEIMPKGWYNSLIQKRVKQSSAHNQIKLPVIYEKMP